MAIRVIFFGTAQLACASLARLASDDRFQVLGVVTQPDKPRGRDLRLQPSAVKALALEKSLPVLQPQKARDPGFIQQLRELAPDLMVVVAYGQILPEALLDVPRFGAVNVHTSLLPKYRGAAPIQWALLNGDSETGVTIMKMDAGLDTGPILTVAKTPITQEDNSQTLHDRLAQMGADLLVRAVPAYVVGEIKPEAQPEGANYARKITKEDGLIDWNLSATEISNRLRAFTPWPGAFTWLVLSGKKRLLKIWKAHPLSENSSRPPGAIIQASRDGIQVACGQGTLLLIEVQREGSRRMPAAEFLSGSPLQSGELLGQNS